jgi:hypothetical protein
MKLFVCYRPADLEEVERLHDGLAAAFGYDPVIRDPEAIPIHADRKRRAEYVGDWLRAVSAVLVVIGPGWLEAIDARGRRRLRRRDDPVRRVIEAARPLGLPLVPVLVGGARLPDAAALPRSLQGVLQRTAHPIRRGPGFEADVDGLAADLFRIRDGRPHPVTWVEKSEHPVSMGTWWKVRFRMRMEHTIVYALSGIPSACRLEVDGVEVWRSKRSLRRLPTADVPFRIESENADGWLVLKDQSNAVVLGQTVDIWIETTRVLHFRRSGRITSEW